jgi:hypothetical protein
MLNKMALRITRFWRAYFPLPSKWKTRRFARFYGTIIQRDWDVLTKRKEKKQLTLYVNDAIIKKKILNILSWYNWNVNQINFAWDRFKSVN